LSCIRCDLDLALVSCLLCGKMVVLSTAILSKTGKVLMARQFVDMNRIRIEGILAAFPKLIDSGGPESGSGKQHTYVETGSIRYVYQPIEGLYLVLVTTRGSNIVQDLDTLRLLSKILPEYAVHVTEEEITRNVFDLIFAFDEVITLGYRENVTIETIRTNMEMDSHNEKLHLMVMQSKMKEADEEARRKASAIKASKAANAMSGMGPSGMQGMGNNPMMSGSGPNGMMPDFNTSSGVMGSSSMGGSGISGGSTYGLSSSSESAPSKTGMKLGKGLKLGNKAAKGLNTLKQMAAEEGIDANALEQQQSSKAAVAAPGAVLRTDPVEVRIAETVLVVYDKDAALHKIEVKGTVQLLCHEDDARIKLQVQHFGDVSMFSFTPHPNLSKPDFLNSNVMQAKNIEKPFPKGKQLGILKWRFAGKDGDGEELVPVKVVCWPESNGDGTMTVNMELELTNPHLSLKDVVVAIPLNTSEEPEIQAIEGGSTRHNARKHQLEWELPLVDENNPGANLSFHASGSNEADFFPVNISFTSDDLICPIHISEVVHVENSEPVKFGLYRQLEVDKYQVVAEAD